jgi:outer membrane protein assembly factor BamB
VENKLSKILISSLGLSVTILIIVWLNYDPTKNLSVNSPGLDSIGMGFEIDEQEINIGEFYKEFQAESAQMSESWPRFRGADFDNISKSEIKLISEFPENGPKKLWSHTLGEGHGGAAIYKGLVYILDYDEDEKADMLRCFNLKSGEEIWRRWYKVRIKRNHGISRTVPAVTEDYILTIGPRCHVMCTKRENGDFLWGIDIEKEFNSESPLWYTGQCPLIYDNEAIIATGGDNLIIGVDIESGNINWKVPNKDSIKMSHSSIMPFDFNGTKMFVYAGIGAVVGISAENENKGELLWTEKQWNHSVVAPSPLCMPDGKIFLSAGYGAGSMLLQLNENNGEFNTDVLYEYKPAKGLASEQQTPVFYKNKLFGILPKDAASFRNQLVCAEPDNPQKFAWTSGKTNRFGLGPYMIADDKIYFLDDDGTLFIAEASIHKFNELDRFKVLDGHDAWAPIAIANGYMVIRDSKTMICLDLNIDAYE